MTQEKIVHDTFTIERTFDVPPSRVFEALGNPAIKAKWFVGPPSWTQGKRTMDFRVGGREHLSGTHGDDMSSIFDAQYLDIVTNERVVYVYEMTVNGRKISTSLATFELIAIGGKTKLRLTEQGAYFEDAEMKKYAPNGQAASRLEGTEGLMDRLAGLFAK